MKLPSLMSSGTTPRAFISRAISAISRRKSPIPGPVEELDLSAFEIAPPARRTGQGRP